MKTAKLTSRFEEALVYATQLHRHQIRKVGGTPYVGHLLSVAGLVIEDGGDEDQAIAALLHDAVEDQGGAETLKEIRQRFGERVAEIVEGCSDTDVVPKPPWRERKEQYLVHLSAAPGSVYRVAIADKLHNASCLLRDYRQAGEEIWSQFRGGKEGTLWFYRSILEIKPPLVTKLWQDLKEVVRALESL